MTTTITTVAGDFTAAGIAQQVVAHQAARRKGAVDAKLDAKLDATVQPDVLRLALEIWVTFGFLTPEQAQALLKALTGGTFVNLPPLPVPDGVVLHLPLYNIVRGAIAARVDSVDVSIEDLLALGQAIVDGISHIPDIVHLFEEAGSSIGDALSAIGDFFGGLF
jgi:hypothetical protein